MPSIKVRNADPRLSWGSIVNGVDYDALNDDGVRADLNKLFEDRGMLVFEDVDPTARMQVEISNVFGPLKPHPASTTSKIDDNTYPGVIDMHSLPQADDDDIGKVLLNGKKTVRYSPWHFDHCYNDELNRAGVLRAVINAPEGGRTGFTDGVELYNKMDPELIRRIEDKNIIYKLDVRLSKMRFGRPPGFQTFGYGEFTMKNVREGLTFPRAMHPAVWTRASGEKVFHVGPWMSFGIEHHEDPEGEELYEAVCQELNRVAAEYSYWHDWKPTTMVVWDNWRMMHSVEGNDPKYERRTQRTTIKGDYGLGYFEDGKKVGEVLHELEL